MKPFPTLSRVPGAPPRPAHPHRYAGGLRCLSLPLAYEVSAEKGYALCILVPKAWDEK